MSVGVWIFLSVLVACFTVIFCITQKRWNWKKIIVRGSLSLVTLALLVLGLGYWYFNTPLFPTKEDGISTIKLGYSEGDVKFFFGEPKEIREKTKEQYRKLIMTAKSGESTPRMDDIHVTINDNKVIDIAVLCTVGLGAYTIQGIGCWGAYDEVIKKFGKPSFVSIHKNEISRIISYKQYQVFFYFHSNRVIAFGVYNPQIEGGEARRFATEDENVEPTQPSREKKEESQGLGKALAEQYTGRASAAEPRSDAFCSELLKRVTKHGTSTPQIEACKKQLEKTP